MSDLCRTFPNLPPEQQAIWAKCFHPSGNFVEFRKEEIEQSIPDRFERQVRKYPDRIAVRTTDHTLAAKVCKIPWHVACCQVFWLSKTSWYLVLLGSGKLKEPLQPLQGGDAS